MNFQHEPVAADTVVELMGLTPGAKVVDCCVGFAGHARRFLAAIAPDGYLLGTDLDPAALERAEAVLGPLGVPFDLEQANYTEAPRLLAERGIETVQAVFLDLGVCSLHFDAGARGFSAKQDGPLDMRFDTTAATTAADIVNQWSRDDLARLFWDYGDERQARAIAQAIVERRRSASIATTRQLATICERVKGKSRQGIHAGTKVMMALRMQVNHELENLASILDAAPSLLAPGGVLLAISYHSKEDKLVKEAMRDGVKRGLYSDATRKPIVPSPAEVAANPRSRSAKIRRAIRAEWPC